KKDPIAMELRWMNLLYEASSQGNSTIIVIPANIPVAGVSAVLGTYGLEKIVGAQQKREKDKDKEP
ncbi:MAG: hypothetical protein ACFFCD_16950, partial [Promethearchaeota archaeon]